MNTDPRKRQTMKVLDATPFGQPTAVFKTTRAGATTGLCASAIDAGKKFLVISSTKRARDITEEARTYSNQPDGAIARDTYPFLSNHECLKNQADIIDFPRLKDMPFLPLGDCDKCLYSQNCPIMEVITHAEGSIGFGITYQKLAAVMFSTSAMANSIREIITNCDVIIFDEVHHLETDVVVNSVPVRSLYPGDWLDPFFGKKVMMKLFLHFFWFESHHQNYIQDMYNMLNKGDGYRDLISMEVENEFVNDWMETQKAYSTIISAIKQDNYLLNKSETVALTNIIQLMSQKTLYLHGLTTQDGLEVNFSSIPSVHVAIKWFLEMLKPRHDEVKILFTTATFGDMTVYEDVFGEYHSIRMEDVMHTNRMVTVIADTFTLDTKNLYGNKKADVIDACVEWEKKHPGGRFITMRKKYDVKFLRKELIKRGVRNPNIDWFRSSGLMGVSSDERVACVVGLPALPANVYDPGARSCTHSQQKRTQSIHAAFYQAIGRFKDPAGKEPCEITCIGVTKRTLEQLNIWGENRQIHIDLEESKFRLNTTVTCDNPFEGFIIKSKTNFLRGKLHIVYHYICNIARKKLVLENMLDGFIKVRVNDKGVKWDADMIDGHFNGSPISGYDINKDGYSNIASITLDDPTQRDTLISYLEDVEMPFTLERIDDKFTFWFFFKGVKSDVVFKLMRHACMMGGVKQRGKGRAEIHPVESGLKSTGALGHYRVLPFAAGSEIIHPRKLIPMDEFEIGVITVDKPESIFKVISEQHYIPDNYSEFLTDCIINRKDIYARQTPNGKYSKVLSPITPELINQHLSGDATFGGYQVDNDKVKWGLFDVDNHKGKKILPPDMVIPKVKRIIKQLKKDGIPFLLGESSPGSFHIWIFFDSVQTSIAYHFMHGIFNSTGLDDVEVFPKQKEVKGDGFGNLVRAPLGIHQEKRGRYVFIDPGTFEPIDSFEVKRVDISNYLIPSIVKASCEKRVPDMYIPQGEIKPCLVESINSGVQLVGADGNYMRVFIACAYLDAGETFETVCGLFSNQDDYGDGNITRSYVQRFINGDRYRPKCSTLREQCGKFVNNYCKNCKYNHDKSTPQ